MFTAPVLISLKQTLRISVSLDQPAAVTIRCDKIEQRVAVDFICKKRIVCNIPPHDNIDPSNAVILVEKQHRFSIAVKLKCFYIT